VKSAVDIIVLYHNYVVLLLVLYNLFN